MEAPDNFDNLHRHKYIEGALPTALSITGASSTCAEGTWIALAEQELELAPGESRVLTFTVSIPNDARPGQYVGALVAENTARTTSAGEGPIRVHLRTVVATEVQVNLPGSRVEKLTIAGIAPTVERGDQKLLLTLRNVGTEMIKPKSGERRSARRWGSSLDPFFDQASW